MKSRVIAVFITIAVTGCSTTLTEPDKPSGQARVNVNNATVIAEAMSSYYKMKVRQKIRGSGPRSITKLTVSEILATHVPDDFKVYSESDVDLDTVINYDTAKPWTEALGRPLFEAGIIMTADLNKRLMSLKTGTITIEQALNRSIPEEYTVYADEAVNLEQPIKYNRKKHWSEALGKVLANMDIMMTTNVDLKLVTLKPKESRWEQGKPKGMILMPSENKNAETEEKEGYFMNLFKEMKKAWGLL